MSLQNADWLEKFKKENGRPLRVLHLGNVANNAYLNAKLLRQVGIDADAFCYDYYHVMGCAEWEELDIQHDCKDDFFPRFDKKDLKGYKSPDWFIHGPLPLCYLYILAKFKNRRFLKSVIRIQMNRAKRGKKQHQQGTLIGYIVMGGISPLMAIVIKKIRRKFNSVFNFYASIKNRVFNVYGSIKRRVFNFYASIKKGVFNFYASIIVPGFYGFIKKVALAFYGLIKKVLFNFLGAIGKLLYMVGKAINFFPKRIYRNFEKSLCLKIQENLILDKDFCALVQEFEKCFPERQDKLKYEELVQYKSVVGLWRDIFAHYDIVQCYGTDPIIGMLVNPPIYTAYEHGTLREFTMGDHPVHRLNALGYRKADHVFITNGDCLAFAEKLGIKNYSAMIHPIDVCPSELNDASAKQIKEEYGADVLILCPTRHDWALKGVDIHLRALPEICKRAQGKVVLLLVAWGQEIERSCQLIEELGCTENVRWLKPLCRKRLTKLMYASDIVLDQMILPTFGGITPHALAVGTPVIMSYVPESTDWIVKEPPPILRAFNQEEVVEAVLLGLDFNWRLEYKKEAAAWVAKYFPVSRIVNEHVRVYKQLIEKKQGK